MEEGVYVQEEGVYMSDIRREMLNARRPRAPARPAPPVEVDITQAGNAAVVCLCWYFALSTLRCVEPLPPTHARRSASRCLRPTSHARLHRRCMALKAVELVLDSLLVVVRDIRRRARRRGQPF
jgi:hypothetical protein